MRFGSPWGTAFYTGGGTSSLVPSRFPFALAGRGYLLDERADRPGAENGDLPVQREQTDDRAEPGEATLSTQGYWRRTVETWEHGAGQEDYDRRDSDPKRFSASSGIDPWERYEISLLPAVTQARASANTNLRMAVAGDRLYLADGNTLRFTTDLAAWTTVTGTPAAAATSIASDGSTVYVGYGASGIYTVAAGATAATSYATGTVSAVAYAKGRLLAVETSGASPRVYNVTATGAVTAGNLLLTVPGATFEPGQWAAEGPSAIYLAAFVGDKTRLWRTSVKPDGTALDVPIIAGQLPDGQTVRAIADYLGSLLLLGTDDRVWVGEYDGAGNVVQRGNIVNNAPVRAFEHQDRYVWYSRGDGLLGRIDVATNVTDDAYQPAAAADLSAGVTGAVLSAATYLGRRVFTVSGQGVYAETTARVASGTLETGRVRFGIGDVKNMLCVDVRHRALPVGASVTVEARHDDGEWVRLGVSADTGATVRSLDLGQGRAEAVELRLTLAGGAVVTGLTLRALPAPPVGELWRFHVRLYNRDTDMAGGTVGFDSAAERAYLKLLRTARTAVTVQHGVETFTGVVDSLPGWRPEAKAYDDNGAWTGRWNGVQEVIVRSLT